MKDEVNVDHIQVRGVVFSEANRSRFRNFISDVKNLRSTDWFRNGMPAGVTFNWGTSMEPQSHFRDWEQIQVVLLRIRPFILQDESNFLLNIRKALLNDIRNQVDSKVFSRFDEYVKLQTKGFDGSDSVNGLTVGEHGNIINKSFLMKYLNSLEFHRVESIAVEIEDALRMNENVLRGVISIVIYNITISILNMSDVILSVASEEDRILLI